MSNKDVQLTQKQTGAIDVCVKKIEGLKSSAKPSAKTLLTEWNKLAKAFKGSAILDQIEDTRQFLAFIEKHSAQFDTRLFDLVIQILNQWHSGVDISDNQLLKPLYHYATSSLGLELPIWRDEHPAFNTLETELTALNQHKTQTTQTENTKSAPPLKSANKNTAKKSGSGFGKLQDSTRVKNTILAELLNSSEELVQIRNTLEDISNRLESDKLKEMSSKLSLVSSNILEHLLTARMRPVNTMLSKYNRIVHDLSKDLDKKIHLDIDADGIELDINILEAINEPLTHIVRNSLDHGIETPDERSAKGKDPEGHLLIQARNETGNVVISIKDDGKGIDATSVTQKAIEKGLIRADEADRLTDKEQLELIFHPGLSTAASVSSISGRGVGMNVVKSQVEEFQGSVSIESKPGEGTKIDLRFPLTMATLRVAILEINGVHYALPSKEIQQLISVAPDDYTGRVRFEKDVAILSRNNEIIPLFESRFFLSASLAPPPLKQTFEQGKRSSVVIFETKGGLHGLVVDDIVSFMDIIIKPIDDHMNPLGLFSGTAVLGDASLAMVFDLKKLVRIIEKQFADVLSSQGLEQTQDEQKKIA